MRSLTPEEAYLAMFAFLDGFYSRTKSDDVGALLGAMSFLSDGGTADPAMAQDWKDAVEAAISGSVDAALRLS